MGNRISRSFAAICIFVFPFFLCAIETVSAANILVNSIADTANSGDGDCTLREAITNANDNAQTFVDCDGDNTGADTINFSVSGTITLTNTLPDISSEMTIDGVGQSVTISGDNFQRVVTNGIGGNLTLVNLTITEGGLVPGSDSGIFNHAAASLSIINCTFRDNFAASLGGAIYSEGTLVVTNSTFWNNSATLGGGAIVNFGSLIVINSTFSNNSSPSGGGCIANEGNATVSNSIFANSVGSGNCFGTITDGGNNLQFGGTVANSCGATIPTPASDPLGGNTLANNGGPTQTIALPATSAAIDAANDTVCEADPVNNLDQRGEPRGIDADGTPDSPATGDCDIGAFELQPASEIEAAIDIKFCSNPNAFNCKKRGVLPVTIFGSNDLDVDDIDVNTVELCLASDPDECVSAIDIQFPVDRGDPDTDPGTNACTVIEGVEQANPDGFDDVDVLFDAREVAELIGCPLSKGTISDTLILKGELTDGTPFISNAEDDIGIDQLLIQK